MKTNINFWSYLTLLEWEMFQTKVLEENKTHISCSITFWKSCRLWYNVEKYCRPRQATDSNVVYEHFMLDT